MSGDSGQEVEEVVDDVLPGIRIDTHRNESMEGISCHVRICL